MKTETTSNAPTNYLPLHDINSNKPRQIAFDVYLCGKQIDTVFYSSGVSVDSVEVKTSLVNHDGYDSRIIVRKRRK
jgi:hypothetical protein